MLGSSFVLVGSEEGVLSELSTSEFEDKMGITYLSSLAFPSERLKRSIFRKSLKWQKKGYFSRNQLWQGAYYKDEISKGAVLPRVSIRWVSTYLGWGVFAEQDIESGSYIGEYTGIVRRYRRADIKNGYCFEYTIIQGEASSFTIDAKESGGLTRFINHSYKANLKITVASCHGLSHIIFLANRPIQKGEQLCYDYGPDYWKGREEPIIL